MPESYRLTYVEARRRKRGGTAWYFSPPAAWRRAGIKGERLPDDEGARLRRHVELMARGRRRAGARAGSFGAYVQAWMAGRRFAALAPATRLAYRQTADRLLALWADYGVAEIDRPAVVRLHRALERTPGVADLHVAVLGRVLALAHDDGAIDANPCIRLRRYGSRGRAQLFRPDDCAAWLTAARAHPHGAAMTLYFQLMRFTGQRPGDVLALPWSAWDGERLGLRQQKRGAVVSILAVAELRRALAAAPRDHVTIVVAADGRPLGPRRARDAFNAIRHAAALDHLQARDLRRTAVVNLALAGCDAVEIRHITGHSQAAIAQMLDRHYLPRQQAIADRAITKMADWLDRE